MTGADAATKSPSAGAQDKQALSGEDITAMTTKAIDEEDFASALSDLPEEVRNRIECIRLVIPKFQSAEPEDQQVIIECFPMMKKIVLPEAVKLVTDRLVSWLNDVETNNFGSEKEANSMQKRLQELMKEISGSALLAFAKDDDDYQRKTRFFFALGCSISLGRSGPKPLPALKKVPILQTWCQRLTDHYFKMPEDLTAEQQKVVKKQGGNIVEAWLRGRRNRTFALWKLALQQICKVYELKAQLCVDFLRCFDGEKGRVLEGQKHIWDASPGKIKLCAGERNPLFIAFHELVKKECVDKPCASFYKDYLQSLPAFSIDLPKFVKLLTQALGKENKDFFQIEAATDDQMFVSLTESGKAKLHEIMLKLNPNAVVPMAGNKGGPGGPMMPPLPGGAGPSPNSMKGPSIMPQGMQQPKGMPTPRLSPEMDPSKGWGAPKGKWGKSPRHWPKGPDAWGKGGKDHDWNSSGGKDGWGGSSNPKGDNYYNLKGGGPFDKWHNKSFDKHSNSGKESSSWGGGGMKGGPGSISKGPTNPALAGLHPEAGNLPPYVIEFLLSKGGPEGVDKLLQKGFDEQQNIIQAIGQKSKQGLGKGMGPEGGPDFGNMKGGFLGGGKSMSSNPMGGGGGPSNAPVQLQLMETDRNFLSKERVRELIQQPEALKFEIARLRDLNDKEAVKDLMEKVKAEGADIMSIIQSTNTNNTPSGPAEAEKAQLRQLAGKIGGKKGEIINAAVDQGKGKNFVMDAIKAFDKQMGAAILSKNVPTPESGWGFCNTNLGVL
ncbi:unnamed protein product [Amoebophrya sp. A120]|nr:unnamed protein product [Amoebophrya sp. A120]|eukprot:GSA120T00016063001.1